MHGRIGYTSLDEILKEMSEFFDKQGDVQKEKNFWGSHKLLQAHEIVCNENETKKQTRKNNVHIKILLMEGGSL